MPIVRDKSVVVVDAKMLADPNISCELKGYLATLDTLDDDNLELDADIFKEVFKESKEKLARIMKEGVRAGYILKRKNKLTGENEYEI